MAEKTTVTGDLESVPLTPKIEPGTGAEETEPASTSSGTAPATAAAAAEADVLPPTTLEYMQSKFPTMERAILETFWLQMELRDWCLRDNGIVHRLDDVEAFTRGINCRLKKQEAFVKGVDGRLKNLEDLMKGIDCRLNKQEELMKGIDSRLWQLEALFPFLKGIDGRLRQLEALFSFVKGIDGRLNTLKASMDGQLNALRVTVEGINGRLKKIEIIEECRGGRARPPNDQRRECEGAPAAATAAMSTSTGGNSGRRQIIGSPSFNPSAATATGIRKQTTHAGQPPAYASEKPEALHVNKDNADVGSTNPTSNTSAAAVGEIEVNMAEPKNCAKDTVGPVYHLPITRSMSKLHLVTAFKGSEAEAPAPTPPAPPTRPPPAPAERPRPRPYRCKLCPKRRHSPIPTFPNAEELKEHYATRHRHPMARICREGASASDSSITGAGVRRSPRGITVKQKQGKNAAPAEEVKKDKDTPKQQQRKKESEAVAAGTGPAKRKSSKSQTPNLKPSPSATTTTATDRSRRGAPGRRPHSGRSCPPTQPCDCEPKITASNVNVKVKRQRSSSPSPLPSTSTSKKVRLGVDDGHQDAVSLRLRTCPECLLVLATPYHMHRHMQSLHLEPTFSCEFCKKKFSRQDKLKEHQQRAHWEMLLLQLPSPTTSEPAPLARSKTCSKLLSF